MPAGKFRHQTGGTIGKTNQRVSGESQGENTREDSLKAEVDREELLLDSREAGTIDRPERYDAIDEGLSNCQR